MATGNRESEKEDVSSSNMNFQRTLYASYFALKYKNSILLLLSSLEEDKHFNLNRELNLAL